MVIDRLNLVQLLWALMLLLPGLLGLFPIWTTSTFLTSKSPRKSNSWCKSLLEIVAKKRLVVYEVQLSMQGGLRLQQACTAEPDCLNSP